MVRLHGYLMFFTAHMEEVKMNTDEASTSSGNWQAGHRRTLSKLQRLCISMLIACCGYLASETAIAAPCTSLAGIGDPNAHDNCYGAGAMSTLYWRPDGTQVFTSTSGHTGTGGSRTLTGAPGFVYETEEAWGSVAAQAQTSGVAAGGSGLVNAQASLAEGTLRFFGTATSVDTNLPVADTFSALTKLADVISIITPKTILSPSVTFTLDINGAIVGPTPGAYTAGVAQGGLQVALIGQPVYYQIGDFQAQYAGTYSDQLVITFDPSYFAEDGGDDWLLDIKLDAYLFGLGGSGFTFDFSHTAQLGVTVSDGITFGSASGIFLTGGSQVPEPATLHLAILGLFSLVFRNLRRPPVLSISGL